MEQSFLQLADPLPEAMLLVGLEGAILAANRSASNRLLAVPWTQSRAAHLRDIVTESEARLRECLRTWGRTPALTPCLVTPRLEPASAWRADGARIRTNGSNGACILLRLTPREEASARFMLLNRRIAELSHEIARRQDVERELRAQREWLQVTLQSIGDGVIATDSAGRINLMNPLAEQLTGWRMEEARGRELIEIFRIVNEDTRAAVANPVDKVLKEGKREGLANHTVLIARDGTERPIADAAAPILGSGGDLLGVVLVFHDVTEPRKLERDLRARAAELVEADRQKDHFLAVLAHELRNPLAPIRTGVDLLRLQGSDERMVARVSELMSRQVAHMVRLIDDLLDIPRITRGQITLQWERIDLVQLLRSAIDDQRARYLTAGVTLELTARPEHLRVLGDRTRLAQVMENLLDNARKFTEPGGTVSVTLRADDRQAHLVVRDTGIGIDRQMLVRLFRPFEQADRSLHRTQGGLGLGLALAKSLVELHGGHVEAHSEGEGRGAEFSFRLPLEHTLLPIAPQGAKPIVGVTSRRVLIIEDNLDAASSLQTLLELMGYEVRLCTTGPEGVDAALMMHPDVVLCDLGLPGMDGYEVAKRLRRDPVFSATRLIALSGYGRHGDKERAEQAGFDAHLTKPVELDVLLAAFGEHR